MIIYGHLLDGQKLYSTFGFLLTPVLENPLLMPQFPTTLHWLGSASDCSEGTFSLNQAGAM
jgi:hypothetical protein